MLHKSSKWAASTVLLGLFAAAPALAGDVVIHAGRLIDAVSRTVRENVSILVRNDRIVSVTAGYTDPPGAEVIDLSKETVLPGLIDCHVHLLMKGGSTNPRADGVTHTAFDSLLVGVRNAHATLLAGFTSVRDVAAYTPAIIALKKAIASDGIEGPRMWVSGSPLGPTGGHVDPRTGYDEQITKREWTDGIVDSPEEAIKNVREHHRAGTDIIKIVPSGGVISVGDDPEAQLMTDAEIKAAIDTAHTLHMKVAAHAHGKGAIDHAVALGVDSIEHGTFADEETYKAMKAHGTYLVPTMIAGATVVEYATKHPEMLNPSSVAKALAVGPTQIRNGYNAYKAGVKIAFGTDAGVSPHGENAKEFRLMVDAGIPAMDAILAATSSAADLIGDPADIGSIQPGRYADIIATRGDPVADVDQLQHVDFVMKGGKVVKPATP
jgi:imidazolonepropionase-like amidohydrolase